MKISIITVSLNSALTIRKTIESVLNQTYSQIEYIIIDGNSDDSTVDIIKEYEPFFGERLVWISEPDDGIYSAMNKGINMSSGTVVGLLNSDDQYTTPQVIFEVATEFVKSGVDVVFGDLHYYKGDDTMSVYRTYSGALFKPWMFRWGIMPPHPTFFVQKKFYCKYGVYNTTFDISGDYELMVRFLYVNRLTYSYIPNDMVAMKLGEVSSKSLMSIIYNNSNNIIKACRMNGVYTNFIMITFRYLFKIVGFIRK